MMILVTLFKKNKTGLIMKPSSPWYFLLSSTHTLSSRTAEQVHKGMGSQSVVVCVGKYPGGKSHSRFYRVLLKLQGMHSATGSKGLCTLRLALLRVRIHVWVLGMIKPCLYSSLVNRKHFFPISVKDNSCTNNCHFNSSQNFQFLVHSAYIFLGFHFRSFCSGMLSHPPPREKEKKPLEMWRILGVILKMCNGFLYMRVWKCPVQR